MNAKLTGCDLKSKSGTYPFVGRIEEIKDGIIKGWVLNLEDSDNPVYLAVFLNGRTVGTVVPNLPRGDISQKINQSVSCGFTIRLSDYADNITNLPEAEPVVCSVFVHGTDIQLGYSPVAIGPETLQSLRRRPDETSVEKKQNENQLRVFFFPDYRETNPYQTLLYSGFPKEWNAVPGRIFDALEYVEQPEATDTAIFHLHWTAPILGPARTAEEAERFKTNFIRNLTRLSEKGCRIVWTIHNVLPHDDRFRDTEIDLREQIGRIADRIHIHSAKSIEQITAVYELPKEQLCVVPHGNYVNVYPNYVTRDQARKRFTFVENDVVYLFLGQLRPYKGIEELFTAFSRLHNRNSRAKLLIAGQPVHPYRQGMITSKANILQGVTVVEGHIPDDQLQWFFNAADIVVLPYRKILTSGSVLNAMSFSRPVIAPDVGMLNDFVKEGITGYRLEAGNADDLFRKMEAFLQLGADQRVSICKRAFKAIEPFTWDKVGPELFSTITRRVQSIDSLVAKAEIKIESGTYCCELVDRLAEAPSPGRVAIIILNYNHVEDTIRAVASLQTSSYRTFDIIVVDNHSDNTSIHSLNAQLDSCTLIRSPSNLGYAGGNNLAIEYIREKGFEFVWVLNPDAVVEIDTLAGYVNAASEHKDINIFGAVIANYFDPGKVWFGGGMVDMSRGLKVSHMFAGADLASVPNEPYEVDYITGASLFVRKDVFSRVGPIPERYFLYFEETDWCFRARQQGERLLLVPSVRLRHAKRSEERNIPTKTYFYYYIRNFLLFASEYNPGQVFLAHRTLVQDFIVPWIRLIGDRCPQEKAYYELLAKKALLDGGRGVSGRVNLFNLLDKDNAPGGALNVNGYLDNVDSKSIDGWVMNQHQPLERLEVSVFIDDDLYQHVPANRHRGDLESAGIGDGFYGFSTNTPRLLLDSKPHRVTTKVRGTDIDLSGSPITVTLKAPPTKYTGRMDGIIAQYLLGWAQNEGDPEEILSVEVLCDGKVITSGLANHDREDLLKEKLKNFRCGFRLPFPVRLCQRKKTFDLKLRIKNTNRIIESRKIEVEDPIGLRNAPHSPAKLLRMMYHYREILLGLPGNANNPALNYFETLHCLLKEQYVDLCQDRLVSVIMPAYNRGDIIVASINSVINQSYDNWELLIIDDGSDDGTSDVVTEFAKTTGEKRIQLIRLEQNRGVSHARNVGLEHANGDVFAYLDSDNIWKPDYLLIMLNSLLDSGWAQSVYCGQETWRMISGEEVETELYSLRIGGFNRPLLENRNYIDLNVFMHNRALYDRFGGFREDMTRLVDWELILRYTSSVPPKFVPLFLNHYFIGKAENQITAVGDFPENFRIVQASIEASDSFLYSDTVLAQQETRPDASLPSHHTFIVTLPANDGDTLGLALNALIANTCFKNATVIVHIDQDNQELIAFFTQNYARISAFQLELVDGKASDADVIGRAMKKNDGHFVLLNAEAIAGHGWLWCLQQAAQVDPAIAAVVSREIRTGAEAVRMGIPYISLALKADVTVKPNQIVNDRFYEQKALIEISQLSAFCTYFPYDTVVRLKHVGHDDDREGEWIPRLSTIIREMLGKRIIYTPYSKVFNVTCFR